MNVLPERSWPETVNWIRPEGRVALTFKVPSKVLKAVLLTSRDRGEAPGGRRVTPGMAASGSEAVRVIEAVRHQESDPGVLAEIEDVLQKNATD